MVFFKILFFVWSIDLFHLHEFIFISNAVFFLEDRFANNEEGLNKLIVAHARSE